MAGFTLPDLVPVTDSFSLPFSHHALPSQQGSSDSHSSEELPASGGYRGLRRCSSGSEDGDHETFEEGIQAEVDTLSPACCAGTSVHVHAVGSSHRV